jgi:catechol 2,3-dioxygenase-like lactoylglutathione lyase family enzyme
MKQTLAHVALIVRDYDEAIRFFTEVLQFRLIEDTYIPEQDKRWVLVAPRGSRGTSVLLARPSNATQEAFVGNQTGGRITFFLETDDFDRDYRSLTASGVEFVRPPVHASYGTVAVFKDLYGNLWDLIQRDRTADAERARGGVTYEITASVRVDVIDSYERYMRDVHIPDLLATGCFASASLSRSEPGRYRIRYEAPDQAALDRYLATHASELRARVDREFGSAVSLAREVWVVLDRLPEQNGPAT